MKVVELVQSVRPADDSSILPVGSYVVSDIKLITTSLDAEDNPISSLATFLVVEGSEAGEVRRIGVIKY